MVTSEVETHLQIYQVNFPSEHMTKLFPKADINKSLGLTIAYEDM